MELRGIDGVTQTCVINIYIPKHQTHLRGASGLGCPLEIYKQFTLTDLEKMGTIILYRIFRRESNLLLGNIGIHRKMRSN